jgi:hypothetical protein
MIPSGEGGSAKWQYEIMQWITSSKEIATLITLIPSGEGGSAICNMKIMQ